MQNKIIPIFIIGSARNGTTNLENTIASLPQVAGAEHWLHYGSHESNIYQHKKYWGDITSVEDYISFLHRYASYDYFKLCRGNIDFHLKHRQKGFYSFFFDLMDHYCQQEEKKFWITKLDPQFFLDTQELHNFLSIVSSRYKEIKFIRIQREFETSFRSYLKMEGKNQQKRKKTINLWPALLLQASRYALTYSRKTGLEQYDIMDISFEAYIKDRRNYLLKICAYLEIENRDIESLDIDRFQVNTSFVEIKHKELPKRFSKKVKKAESSLSKFPMVAHFIWRVYEKIKPQPNPDFRRLTKYDYFQNELLEELKKSKSVGLIKTILDKRANR